MKRVAVSLVLVVAGMVTGIVATSQTTTIKTPTNVNIEAVIYPEFSDPDLALVEASAANLIASEGWSAVWVGPASRTYNCHNYAWHHSDGGEKRWVEQFTQNGNNNIDKYWSGTEPTYTVTTSLKGAKVFYPNGDHSAIIITPGTFRSKWGNWPLYDHPPTHCPYTATGLQYYNIPVSGNEVICTSNNYSTLNIGSAIYSWTGSSNINVSSNGANVFATGLSDGTAWIQSQISSPFSSTTVKSERKSLWVGKPSTPFAISGFPYNGYVFGSDTEYEFRALTSPGMGLDYYNWVIGCGSIVHGQGTDDIIVRTCTAPDYVTMNFNVSIRVGNECGLSDWLWRTGYVVGESGATYMVYPNPASSEITVALNEKYAEANPEKAHELSINQVRIMDQMGKSLMIKNFYGQELSVRINISALPKGYYIVKINDGESHTILKD